MSTALTWCFPLADFVESDTARRHGIDNTPPAEVVANLKRLCETVLQPAREWVGSPIIVTSGYRCAALNSLVKGSKTSSHMQGLAADIQCKHPIYREALDLAKFFAATSLPFDQLIHEFGGWVHVAIAAPGAQPRRQLLTIDHQGTREGLHPARPKLKRDPLTLPEKVSGN